MSSFLDSFQMLVIVQQAETEKHGLWASSLLKALRLKLPHEPERDRNSLPLNCTVSPITEKPQPL